MIRSACATSALAMATLFLVVTPGIGQEQVVQGGVYRSTLDDPSGICGQGTLRLGTDFTLAVNPRGTRIVSFIVTDVFVQDFVTLAELSIPVDIPIDGAGRFAATFDPLNVGIATVDVSGRFVGDTVSGSVQILDRAGRPECEGTFSGEATHKSVGPIGLSGSIGRDGDCGPGSISLLMSADALSLTQVVITDLQVLGSSVSARATFDDRTVPIRGDGSFDWAYFPGPQPAQEIALLGSFHIVAGPGYDTVSGMITVSPSECEPMRFSASLLPALTPGRGGGPGDIVSLGDTGSGPGQSATPISAGVWLVVAGVSAVAASLAIRQIAATR